MDGKVYVDDPSINFSILDYSRGILGSVVRFGEATIRGRLASERGSQYAGWGVNNIGLVGKQKITEHNSTC